MQRKLFLAVVENGAAETDAALATLPLDIHPVPVSRIVRCACRRELAETAARMPRFDWLLLSSANAATIFFELVNIAPTAFSPRIACVGPDTAARVQALGYRVDFISPEHRGDAFAEAFAQAHGEEAVSVLLPRPEKMGSHLAERLHDAGINVSQLVLYRTEALSPDSMPDLHFDPADLFAFLSPSGVKHFLRRYAIPQGADVFAIGPSTAAALSESWKGSVHTAQASSRNGLLDAVRAFLDNGRIVKEQT